MNSQFPLFKTCFTHGSPHSFIIFYRIFEAGETDLQAAFRVASERRDVGRAAFGDGTKFVAAQEAVDARRTAPGDVKKHVLFLVEKIHG